VLALLGALAAVGLGLAEEFGQLRISSRSDTVGSARLTGWVDYLPEEPRKLDRAYSAASHDPVGRGQQVPDFSAINRHPA
jgi:hypothetical protein